MTGPYTLCTCAHIKLMHAKKGCDGVYTVEDARVGYGPEGDCACQGFVAAIAPCVHRWLLPIGGPTVVGVCRDCKAEREFVTSHEGTVRFGPNGRRVSVVATQVRGADLAAIPSDMRRGDGPLS